MLLRMLVKMGTRNDTASFLELGEKKMEKKPQTGQTNSTSVITSVTYNPDKYSSLICRERVVLPDAPVPSMSDLIT